MNEVIKTLPLHSTNIGVVQNISFTEFKKVLKAKNVQYNKIFNIRRQFAPMDN